MKILSAHPIDPSVKARIMEELTAIEHKHDVKVLFACESGSRGWGFASPDSDYDVRFLYVHRLEWYLRVEAPRDVIELPINDELDIGGWELRKALQLMRKSNPTLLEWLDSPIVYRQDEVATQRLRELAHTFFLPQRGRHHYLSMAKKTYQTHLQDETVRYKKYFYALRPLLAARWVDAGLGMPPMRFADLVERLVTDEAMLAEINALLELKMAAGEGKYGPRRPAIHEFIEAELANAENATPWDKSEESIETLDTFLREMVLAQCAS